MRPLAQAFAEPRRVIQAVRMEVILLSHQFDEFAVDTQALVMIIDAVARQTDDPLDVIQAWVGRITEHHYITTLRVGDVNDLLVDDRQPNAVRPLLHQDEIADQQCRDHGSGRDAERFDHEGAQTEDDQDHREEARTVFNPPRRRRTGRSPLASVKTIKEPQYAGDHQQDEEDECEVHWCSVSSSALCGSAPHAGW